jgi:hypothetical protein
MINSSSICGNGRRAVLSSGQLKVTCKGCNSQVLRSEGAPVHNSLFARLNIHRKTCSLLSINGCKAPVLRSASALQLALNLFDFRCITYSDGDFTSEDHVQHVNECISRDVCQFSQHGLGANLKIAICSRNPAARPEHAELDEKHSWSIRSENRTKALRDTPRALTELGQQTGARPCRLAAVMATHVDECCFISAGREAFAEHKWGESDPTSSYQPRLC